MVWIYLRNTTKKILKVDEGKRKKTNFFTIERAAESTTSKSFRFHSRSRVISLPIIYITSHTHMCSKKLPFDLFFKDLFFALFRWKFFFSGVWNCIINIFMWKCTLNIYSWVWNLRFIIYNWISNGLCLYFYIHCCFFFFFFAWKTCL